MTDFLVKCFVKDHDKTEDPQVHPVWDPGKYCRHLLQSASVCFQAVYWRSGKQCVRYGRCI